MRDLWCRLAHRGRFHQFKGVTAWGAVMVCRKCGQTHWDSQSWWWQRGMIRLVILESPYTGDVEANTAYARRCVRDSLSRGEAPMASRLLYTQPEILRYEDAAERQLGLEAGLAWGRVAEATVVYTDHGITSGMEYGIENARRAGRPIEWRSLHEPD